MLAVAWAADVAAVNHRITGVRTAGRDAEPLVVDAQRIQTELTDADATVSGAFLAGGIQPESVRAEYQRLVGAAASDLVVAAAETPVASPVGRSLQAVNAGLATYTGLIEQANAGNRQGFPVGAAYLRDASSLLRQQLIPHAAEAASASAQRVNSGENAATSGTDVVVVVLAGIVVLGVLAVAQLYVTRRTRRAINVGLFGASLLTVVLIVVVLGSMASERTTLARANDQGYTEGAMLARADAAAFQARSDENQALIARGTGQSFLDDRLQSSADVVAGLDAADAALPATAGDGGLAAAVGQWAAYSQVVAAINACDAAGQHDLAVAIDLGTMPATSAACVGGQKALSAPATFSAFDATVQDALAGAQRSFASQVSKANSALRNLTVIVAVLSVLIALLALGGAQARINEYR